MAKRKTDSRLNEEERESRVQDMLDRARRHDAEAERLRQAAVRLKPRAQKKPKKKR